MSDAKTFLATLAAILVVSASVAAAPVGAAAQSDTVPPLDPAHCSDGTYVEEPASYAGLVVDCILLVTIRNHFMSNPANSEVDWDSPWKGTDTSNGRVRSLDLNNNQLTGTIPTELALLTGLEWLGLPRNQLTGPIPAELGRLTNLEVLGLDGNQLTGTIPPQLSNLTSLRWLALHNNRLTGSIPAELGGLGNLEVLGLDGNQLTGTIPPQLSNLTNLRWLALTSNRLSGAIPAELGGLGNLKNLYLSNNQFTETLPPQLNDLIKLEDLDLSGNRLSGPISGKLNNLTSLKNLYLNDNQFSGILPAELGDLESLEWLGLPRNLFTGSIPAELENLTNLRVLGLDGNQLTGPIPLQLINMTNLQWLALDDNQLSGMIPSELGDLTQLGHLSLGGNQLSGPIPSQLGKLSLNELWVQGNRLSGEIPTTLRVAQSFRFCNNQLTGTLPVHLRSVTQYFSGDVDDVSSCYEGAFRDDDGSPHEASIEQIVEWGITQGCADERFCPSRTITRAQMAAFLYRATTHLYGTPDPADKVQLADVGADAWYWTYAQWAIANTVMRAPGGDFRPQAAVTRSDTAEMLVAAFDHLSASPESQDLFSDMAGLPDAAVQAMEGVYDAGVTTECGTAPLRYCPTEEVTRAQMASFLTRAVLLGQA